MRSRGAGGSKEQGAGSKGRTGNPGIQESRNPGIQESAVPERAGPLFLLYIIFIYTSSVKVYPIIYFSLDFPRFFLFPFIHLFRLFPFFSCAFPFLLVLFVLFVLLVPCSPFRPLSLLLTFSPLPPRSLLTLSPHSLHSHPFPSFPVVPSARPVFAISISFLLHETTKYVKVLGICRAAARQSRRRNLHAL